MIEIDGAHGEGGGQIIRTAIAMSAITGKPVRITNIRANRSNPGLQAQHLTGVKAAAELCNAKLKGAELHSTEIEFSPGKIKTGGFRFDIGTAGSITLVLQTLIPIAFNAPGKVRLELIGGTDVLHAPNMDYFQHIFCGMMHKFGADITTDTIKHGFYPKGGGKVVIDINSTKIKPITLTNRGKIQKIDVWSLASKDLQQAKVAERQANSATKIIETLKIKPKNTHIDYFNTLCPGSAIHIHAHFENAKLGCTIIGERGKPAEKVGEDCAIDLLKEINSSAVVDKHLADQLIPFLGLFGGEFVTSEITEHTKTNIWVVEQFIEKKFKIGGNKVSI